MCSSVVWKCRARRPSNGTINKACDERAICPLGLATQTRPTATWVDGSTILSFETCLAFMVMVACLRGVGHVAEEAEAASNLVIMLQASVCLLSRSLVSMYFFRSFFVGFDCLSWGISSFAFIRSVLLLVCGRLACLLFRASSCALHVCRW